MKEYTTTVSLTDNEDAAIAAICAANPEVLTVQKMIDNIKNEHIIGQIRQYIKDEAKKVMLTMDSAEALTKLNV